MYKWEYKPNTSKFGIRLERLTFWFIHVLITMLYLYTNFIYDPLAQKTFCWIYIIGVLIVFIINIITIIINGISTIQRNRALKKIKDLKLKEREKERFMKSLAQEVK